VISIDDSDDSENEAEDLHVEFELLYLILMIGETRRETVFNKK